MVNLAFQEIHQFRPKDWQTEAASYLIDLTTDPFPPTPQSILLAKSTGGGKSAVRDAVGLALGGVTLTIVPLLSLAAD